jgi:hypothetical protein
VETDVAIQVLGAGKDGVLYVLDRNKMGCKAVGDFSKLKAPPVSHTFLLFRRLGTLTSQAPI